jgi:hypothetical protein
MITTRSVKAVLDALRDEELDLPFEVCGCNFDPALVGEDFMTITRERIVLHRGAE